MKFKKILLKQDNMSKENLHLPKTAFSMKADLPKKEPEILKKWEEKKHGIM